MKSTIVYFSFFLLLVFSAQAQTFERNKKESVEDFVARIFPKDAKMDYKPVEEKMGTESKKIIFFSKKQEMDTAIFKTKKIDCLYANVLIPDSVAPNRYSMQTLKIDCNRAFGIQIESASSDKDKEKRPVLSILFAQLNRASTRLLLKEYKTFFLREASHNVFIIEPKG